MPSCVPFGRRGCNDLLRVPGRTRARVAAADASGVALVQAAALAAQNRVPHFFRHSRISAPSSLPMMIRASEPPIKVRLDANREVDVESSATDKAPRDNMIPEVLYNPRAVMYNVLA